MSEEWRQPEASDRPSFLTGRFSRGRLLKVGVAGAATAATGGLLSESAAAKTPAAAPAALRFLTQWEFEYLTAMAETIWPTDDLGPGARQAGVANYIDGQLAGSWGQGHRFYLNGPFFQPPDTGHGWQIPMTPADVYRAFLPGFDVVLQVDLRQRLSGARRGDADAGAHRPAEGHRTDPDRRCDRVQELATSSRSSARTCSRGCSPIPPTAATRTWSAGSTSASRATRCAAAICTSSTSSRPRSTRSRASRCRLSPAAAKQGVGTGAAANTARAGGS